MLAHDFEALLTPGLGAVATKALLAEEPFASALATDVLKHRRDPSGNATAAFRCALDPARLSARTIRTIRDYYIQDFTCLGYDPDDRTWPGRSTSSSTR